MLDGFLDFLDWHAVGFLHLAAVLVDDGQQLGGHRRGTVHDQVGVGDALVDFLDAADGQDVARGLAAELVGAVAGADGNGQGVQLRGLDEHGGFFRVGQHLAVVELAFSANTVFFTGFAGFQVAQAAQFAFDRDAHLVRHVHHLAGHFHVVLEGGRRLAVFHQRAVHHHRAKAQVDGTLADLGRSAVVLVHDERNVRKGLDRCLDEVLDEGLTRIFAGTGAGLQDDRGAHFVGGGHDGLDLLQVVDVEGRDAIAVGSGMVEQFAHRNEGHGRRVR